MIEKAPIIVGKLVAAIIENAPKILAAALELIVKLVTGIINNLPKMAEAGGQIVNTVVGSIKNLASKFVDIGKDIVNGVWQGIQSLASWLRNQVTSLFSGIVNGVKGVLGISSPSKVFAQIGKYTGEGFIDGVTSMAGKVSDAMDTVFGDLSRDVTATLTPSIDDIPQLNAWQNSYGGARVVNSYEADKRIAGITNQFNMPGMVVREEADITKIARKLYEMQARAARGRGLVTI